MYIVANYEGECKYVERQVWEIGRQGDEEYKNSPL
jgi:hypothetical protein